MDNGIGFDGDDEKDDDSSESGEGGESSNTARWPLPEWLTLSFNEKLAESEQCVNGWPPLYHHHCSFWFPCTSTFFLLKDLKNGLSDLFNPQFFLWDPMPLCQPLRIPCPNCKTPLHRHGHICHPCRCIGIDSPFWIIGYHYQCSQCHHPLSQKNTVTFQSWDKKILAILPCALALEFPAVLSHQSSLSKEAFGIMCSCFQSGMGPKQFLDALHMQHLRCHDILHLQYLHSLTTQNITTCLSQWSFEVFLPFNDVSLKHRFNGFVPSAQWLCNIYDHFIESHQQELNQHIALLSAKVCAIDHSHKVGRQ